MKLVKNVLKKYNNDYTRLMDILIDIQDEAGHISKETMEVLSKELNISVVDVEQTVSFYHFFSTEPSGKYVVYLNDSVVAHMMGRERIAEVFEEEAGCSFGAVSSDGKIGLYNTACIGMNDQEPAAIINNVVFPKLTVKRVKEIVADMKAGKKIDQIKGESFGDGKNSEMNALVTNNIKKSGPVLDTSYQTGQLLKEKITQMSPDQVIDEMKASNIRGRGGAGFPTGLKWDFCRKAAGEQKYIFCNADEGEPGTFKDRVILTEKPGLLFEGMAVAGYAVGAKEGVLYLRYEYKYMKEYLENVIEKMKADNLLGKEIAGVKGFDFDIRIQLGAGAYVCGEESALIESAEGKRGEPRDRPPFPVQVGYLDKPTVVNNVETLCLAVKILLNGADWFTSKGTKDSAGTKILSISGDCKEPGIYEIDWGFSINDILNMVEAEDVQAVQVGGPSGSLIGDKEFDRVLCYADLATGGSLIIFNDNRDLIRDVVLNFTDFFIEESCGSCSTCRVLPFLMKKKLEKILSGHGVAQDIKDLEEWAAPLPYSRCGLGQTAGNPIVTSIKNFRNIYDQKVKKDVDYDTGFDLNAAIQESCDAVGRVPVSS